MIRVCDDDKAAKRALATAAIMAAVKQGGNRVELMRDASAHAEKRGCEVSAAVLESVLDWLIHSKVIISQDGELSLPPVIGSSWCRGKN